MIAAPRTRTERQWFVALGLTIGLVLLFQGIGALERAGGAPGPYQRYVRNPSESVARILAIGHTIVATLFLLTSPKARRPGFPARIAGLAALGTGFCVLFHVAGGLERPVPEFVFYSYFLAHELRDEGFLVARNGDAVPEPSPAAARWLAWAPALVAVLVVVAVGAAGVTFGAAAKKLAATFAGIDPTLRTAGGAAVLAAAVAGIFLVLRHTARLEGTTVRGLLARRRARVVVTGGLLVVLFAGAALTGRLYLVVALHVVWWAVFAWDGLRRAPAPPTPPRPLSWAWVKTTPRGFAVFHGAVLLLVAGIAALHAFGARNDPAWTLAVVLAGRDAFPFWTIMHVTLSWLPR